MKKGTKMAVFIASMALTVGSLIAVVGPRHHRYCGMHGQGACAQGNYNNGSCESWNNQTDSTIK